MPCATVHLHLSDRILARWKADPGSAPFAVSDPSLRRAFLHGAMAPDMGFVPGVDRFVSELAHYVDPAGLTRSLFRQARTPDEQAFAWGWASHVLGDVFLHPRVGKAVGERIHGDRERRMNAEEDLPTHVGLEVGLDLALLDRIPGISSLPPEPFLDRRNERLLGGALEATYKLSWDPGELVRSHRRAVLLTALWPRAIRLTAEAPSRSGLLRKATEPVLTLVRSLGRRLSGSDSPMRGFLTPLEPPGWLVDSVLAFGDEIPDLLARLVREGLEALENRNLETGEPAGPGRGHPPSDRAAGRLRARRGSAPDLVPSPEIP
jgi:hypothetical protein